MFGKKEKALLAEAKQIMQDVLDQGCLCNYGDGPYEGETHGEACPNPRIQAWLIHAGVFRAKCKLVNFQWEIICEGCPILKDEESKHFEAIELAVLYAQMHNAKYHGITDEEGGGDVPTEEG